MNISIIIANLVHRLHYRGVGKALTYFEKIYYKSKLGYCGKDVYLGMPKFLIHPQKIYLYDNTNINPCASFIISPYGNKGKFIMKKNSGAANGLTIITGNHQREVGSYFKEKSSKHEIDIDKDIIIEEDVWIGANVTILAGVNVGRGATIGAGSVCVKNVPPYAVVMGNPAKVIGFTFNPEEIIEHEKKLYSEDERIPVELLENNYNKYYISRIHEIKSFLKK